MNESAKELNECSKVKSVQMLLFVSVVFLLAMFLLLIFRLYLKKKEEKK